MADYLNVSIDDLAEKVTMALEEEINDYVKECNGKNITVHRNGYYERTFYTLNGYLELKIPRFRKAKFQSKVLSKFKRTTRDFETMIAFLLQTFMSYEMIIDFIEWMTGIRIGHSIISTVANNLYDRYSDLYEGPIEKQYEYVFIDACYYKVKKYINKETGEVMNARPANFKSSDYYQRSHDMCVFIAIGIDQDGYKNLLSIDTFNSESALSWTTFLERLKARGLNDPKVIISDDFRGITTVINDVFETTKTQKCVIHKLRGAIKLIPFKDRKRFECQMRKIYTSNSKEEATEAFYKLQDTYQEKYYTVLKKIENSLPEMLQFLEHPEYIRRYIYTNNICENFNSALRKYVKEKCSFPSERTFKNLAIIASVRICRSWNNRKINWFMNSSIL